MQKWSNVQGISESKKTFHVKLKHNDCTKMSTNLGFVTYYTTLHQTWGDTDMEIPHDYGCAQNKISRCESLIVPRSSCYGHSAIDREYYCILCRVFIQLQGNLEMIKISCLVSKYFSKIRLKHVKMKMKLVKMTSRVLSKCCLS